MSLTQNLQYAGWFAYLSALATGLALITLFLFSVFGPPWGAIFETVLLLQLLSLLPIALVLWAGDRTESSNLQRITRIIGLAFILVAIIMQVVVVFGGMYSRDFSDALQSGRYVTNLIGFWLILSNRTGMSNNTRKPGIWMGNEKLQMLAAVAAAAYIITGGLFQLGIQSSLLTIIGLIVGGISFAAWSGLLGRMLSSRGMSG